MRDGTPDRTLTLPAGQYRSLDRATKLVGVGLIAGGLNAGGGTTTGLLLAILGVIIGLSTVLIDNQ